MARFLAPGAIAATGTVRNVLAVAPILRSLGIVRDVIRAGDWLGLRVVVVIIVIVP